VHAKKKCIYLGMKLFSSAPYVRDKVCESITVKRCHRLCESALSLADGALLDSYEKRSDGYFIEG